MKKLSAIAALAAVPTASLAQELTYGQFDISVSPTNLPVPEISDTQWLSSARGELNARVGSMELWVEGATTRLDNSDIPTVELRDISFGGRYNFDKQFSLDLSYNNISAAVGELSVSGAFYEIGAGYEGERFFGRASYSVFNDSLVGLDDLYSVQAGYKLANTMTASLSAHFVDEQSDIVDNPLYIATLSYASGRYRAEAEYSRVELSDANDTVEAYLLNLRGEYDISRNVFARAGYSYGDISASTSGVSFNQTDNVDAHRVSAGAGYKINESLAAYGDLTWTELSASAGDSTDGFGVTVGLRYAFGNKTSSLETTRDRVDRAIRGINGF